MKLRLSGQIAAAIASLAFSSFAGAVTYTTTLLPTLGGIYSFASDINNSGQVVGYTIFNASTRATLWNGTTATDLGTLGGTDSAAYGINNSGQVVGTARTIGNASTHATLWNGTTATDLGTLGGTHSYANGINNSGQVVGTARTIGNASTPATLWNGTTAKALGTLSGEATDINDSGQVVGYLYYTTGGVTSTRATLWNGITATDLGTLGGERSAAFGINSSGQVVGKASTIGNAETRATLWNGTTATDLNSFLDGSLVSEGWVLEGASSINDAGSIVGYAVNTFSGERRAFLAVTAVPEPETYALMLTGLCVVGFMAGRRKRAS